MSIPRITEILETGIAVSEALPAGTNNIGDVDVASLPGTVQADIAAMKAKIDTAQADLALIKAQNLPPNAISADLAFDADDLTKDQEITLEGLLKHVYVAVPNWTNAVTVNLKIKDASGRVFYTSKELARNAVYNLETLLDAAGLSWLDQVLTSATTLTVTLSGAAGGSGGTVAVKLRYFGYEVA